MSEPIWVAIIGGVAGLISGAVAALLTPWANWGIEKKKQKLTYRKELVREWRSMVVAVKDKLERDALKSEDGSPDYAEIYFESFGEMLRSEQSYYTLEPHLSDGLRSRINSLRGEYWNNGVRLCLTNMLTEISQLERRWGLV